jgi:hypothetical protein
MRNLHLLSIALCIALFPAVVLPLRAAESTPEPTPRPMVEACRKLMTANPTNTTGPNAPVLHVIQPKDGEEISGTDVTVVVTTDNFKVNEKGQHWHLWVNGQLQTMVFGPGVNLGLAPGTYQICALMGLADHNDTGIPDGVTITVKEPAAGSSSPTPAVNPTVIAENKAAVAADEASANLRGILLLVAGVGMAGVGGWWFGRRLSKRQRK